MCAWMNGRVGVFNTIFGVSSWGTTKKRVLKFKVHVRVTRWMNTFVFSDNPLEGTTINQPSQKWVEKRRTHIIKCRLGISVLKRKSPAFFKIWFEKKILGFRLWRIKCIKRAQLPMQSTLETRQQSHEFMKGKPVFSQSSKTLPDYNFSKTNAPAPIIF